MARPSTPKRIPMDPGEGWTEAYDMLCAYCARSDACEVLNAMIEARDDGQFPTDGFATDPGAGVTCLSYIPKPRAAISRQQLRRLDRMNPATRAPVCGGCAARKGSEASVALHTQRDYRAAVRGRSVFRCHETGEYCGGWLAAILRRKD